MAPGRRHSGHHATANPAASPEVPDREREGHPGHPGWKATPAPAFVPDFNPRFTVVPTERGSAFVKVARSDLELVLSVHHERVVRPDSIVVFEKLLLQLPPTTHRQRFVRCPVLVHEFLSDTLGVSYQGRLIARFNRAGDLLPLRSPTVAAA